jgi:hypothetical protein
MGNELTGDGLMGEAGAIEGDAAGVGEGTTATGLGLEAGGGRGWEAQPERILPKTIAIGRQGKMRQFRFMAISQAREVWAG